MSDRMTVKLQQKRNNLKKSILCTSMVLSSTTILDTMTPSGHLRQSGDMGRVDEHVIGLSSSLTAISLSFVL